MAYNAKKYADMHLSWNKISTDIYQFYEWVKSSNNKKPSFVNIIK